MANGNGMLTAGEHAAQSERDAAKALDILGVLGPPASVLMANAQVHATLAVYAVLSEIKAEGGR
jgi:hypothetical protein